MANKRGTFWFFPAFLAAVAACLTVWSAPAQARSEQAGTIRVAYPLQAGLTEVDEKGAYSGYTYEYLEEIAQYTGWSYEFVQVPGTGEEQIAALLEMVRTGEVDLMGAMPYSEQLAAQYDVCGYSYGTVETVLRVPVDNGQRIVIDPSRMQTVRIAVRAGEDKLVQDLEAFCRMNLVTPVLVECGGQAEMAEALETGRADFVLGTSMDGAEGLRTVASFSPRQLYFITSKENSWGLNAQLNEAVSGIDQADPYFQSSLYEKYFMPRSYELALSEEERSYIQRTGSLTVGVLRDQPPFQYQDREDGTLKGIGVELLEHIAQETGLQFNMVAVEDREELFQMAGDGRIDLIAGMYYHYETAREQGVSMTRPYASSPYILLLNESLGEDNIRGKRLAVSRTSTYHGYFVGAPGVFDTVDACIRAVNSGEADYTYVDTYTAQYYLNLPEFDALKMVPQTYNPAYKICFAIPASSDHSLLRILNKCIHSMSAEELQGIIFANTVQKQPFTVGYFIRENPIPVILTLAGVFVLALLVMIVFTHQKAKASRAIRFELQKHMRLYAVSNDLIFEYDYGKRHLMISIPEREEARTAQILHYDLGDLERKLEDASQSESVRVFLGLLNAQKNCICEERLIDAEGTWHWYRIILETIGDESGRPICAIGRLNLIDAERSERDELREKAQRDGLTQLYNVESCQKQIAQRLSALREGETDAFLILDVDSFKSINDTYGHMRGDDILREVAGLLRKSFRAEDIVGRLGGDEFIAYLGHVDREKLCAKCEALCGAVRGVALDDQRHLTVSVGAVLAHRERDYAALYRSADQALYTAKRAGHDGFEIAPN